VAVAFATGGGDEAPSSGAAGGKPLCAATLVDVPERASLHPITDVAAIHNQNDRAYDRFNKFTLRVPLAPTLRQHRDQLSYRTLPLPGGGRRGNVYKIMPMFIAAGRCVGAPDYVTRACR
jgi:hypothetical protein